MLQETFTISIFNQESLYLGVGAEAFLVKALVHNTDNKINGLIIYPSKGIFASTVGTMGTPAKITAAAQLCRAFDFVHIQEKTRFVAFKW